MDCDPSIPLTFSTKQPIRWSGIYGLWQSFLGATGQEGTLVYPSAPPNPLFTASGFIDTKITYKWMFTPETVTDPCSSDTTTGITSHGFAFDTGYSFRDAENYALSVGRLYFIGANSSDGANANGPCNCNILGKVISGGGDSGYQLNSSTPVATCALNNVDWDNPCPAFLDLKMGYFDPYPTIKPRLTLPSHTSHTDDYIELTMSLCVGSTLVYKAGYKWVTAGEWANSYRLAYVSVVLFGYFGWNIAASDFDTAVDGDGRTGLLGAVNAFLGASPGLNVDTGDTCGCKVMFKSGSTDRVLNGCSLTTLDDLIWTAVLKGLDSPPVGSFGIGTFPWNSESAGSCGKPVYCVTMVQLEQIIDKLSDVLPSSAGTPPTSCCCPGECCQCDLGSSSGIRFGFNFYPAAEPATYDIVSAGAGYLVGDRFSGSGVNGLVTTVDGFGSITGLALSGMVGGGTFGDTVPISFDPGSGAVIHVTIGPAQVDGIGSVTGGNDTPMGTTGSCYLTSFDGSIVLASYNWIETDTTNFIAAGLNGGFPSLITDPTIQNPVLTGAGGLGLSVTMTQVFALAGSGVVLGSATVVAGGLNYKVGDRFTLAGGTTPLVVTVSSIYDPSSGGWGPITGVSVDDPGDGYTGLGVQLLDAVNGDGAVITVTRPPGGAQMTWLYYYWDCETHSPVTLYEGIGGYMKGPGILTVICDDVLNGSCSGTASFAGVTVTLSTGTRGDSASVAINCP